jgi:geranylgeranyl diphosphate synthase, type II
MMDLPSYINERCRTIDKTLDELLQRNLNIPVTLHEAMCYSVFSGGKRLRPLLCLAAAEVVAGEFVEAALKPACAIEIFHTFTLIHDDLPSMDNDDFRRGKPTCHKVFGEAIAILAGDALFSLAFEILADVETRCYSGCDFAREFARIAGARGVIGGQAADILALNNSVTTADIDFIHLHKTADLFAVALKLGAMAANADELQLAALTEYGKCFGLAFQILDDVVDANIDTDAASEKKEVSILNVLSREDAIKKVEALLANALHAIKIFGAAAAPLERILNFAITKHFSP